MADPAGIPALVDAIRHMHGAEATFVEWVPVTEMFDGAVAWQGEVGVFDLSGHRTATRAYAWSSAVDGSDTRRRFVAVLHAGPVDSAVAAVRASVVAEQRPLA